MFISQKLVEWIERNADQLATKWLEDVRKRPETPTHQTFDRDRLYRRVPLVGSQLVKRISYENTKEDIAACYPALGAQRRREGFALSEVIEALILTSRYIWLKVLSDGFLDKALDLHEAMDLNNRVVLFFDRAVYHTALGYEKENV